MKLPWFAPFLVPVFITLVIFDKLTGGAISGALEKEHAKEIDKQFGWKPLPKDRK